MMAGWQKWKLRSVGRLDSVIYCALLLCFAASFPFGSPLHTQARTDAPGASPVTIVLPPRLMANHPATLAALNSAGRLAAGISIKIGGQMIVTDRTGRATFTAPPSSGYVIADASGIKTATLVDPATGASEPRHVTLPQVVSLRNRFRICAPGLQGRADEDQVTINGQQALILAASPECLVVLAPPGAAPGRAKIAIQVPGSRWKTTTTFVSLQFEPPKSALLPNKKWKLIVRVLGSRQKLFIVVANRAPGVLRFMHGNMQQLRTSGGPRNTAGLKVDAIRSGAYSFRARLVNPPDFATAERYLQAAEALALLSRTKIPPREIARLAKQVSRHPRRTEKIRRQLGQILGTTSPGTFRALIAAANSAL